MRTLREEIKSVARELGFTSVGITTADPLEEEGKRLERWIREGRQGEMDWMARTVSERANPRGFFPEAESVLMVTLNYYREEEFFLPSEYGTISLYARGRDYHKVMRKKLKRLLAEIQQLEPATKGRVFVDSFPIMEKALAVRAGLGWIGKNTLLIQKGLGTFFFLGGILLNLPLLPDEPVTKDFCGNCTRCQQACPTGALQPYQIDARRCVSYLTIEHPGGIDPQFHRPMGNLIFGCDICQVACPWNRSPLVTTVGDFYNRFSRDELKLTRLTNLTESEFEALFEGTPVRRAGYQRFQRNGEIALKNISHQ